MAARPKLCDLGRAWRQAVGLVAAGALLTACASQASDGGSAPAAESPSQAYVVYPPVGTAAILSSPVCQLARDTTVPRAKRSQLSAECDQMLSRATDPVTKPVLPTPSPSTPAPVRPPAPDCTANQLDARFVGGGYATGMDFGVIVIWNPTARQCQLHGRLGFAAYYADGSRDPGAAADRPTASGIITLPSNMSPPRDGQDQSNYLTALLAGVERDDPSQPDALCRPQDEDTPASLVLSIGKVTVRVANQDPGSVQVSSIYGCHGRVLLDGLRGPERS